MVAIAVGGYCMEVNVEHKLPPNSIHGPLRKKRTDPKFLKKQFAWWARTFVRETWATSAELRVDHGQLSICADVGLLDRRVVVKGPHKTKVIQYRWKDGKEP